jgi:DNA-binding transcriptional MerR regulator
MASRTYTIAELAEASGFSKRQLAYWATQGILIPSGQQAHGSGIWRLYTGDDLVTLQFIRRLKAAGWSTQKIRAAIQTLHVVMEEPDPLKNAILIHGKTTILALCKTREGEHILLDALSAGGQQVLGIVLELLIEEAQQLETQLETPVPAAEEP